jgi:hypothetical protein
LDPLVDGAHERDGATPFGDLRTAFLRPTYVR